MLPIVILLAIFTYGQAFVLLERSCRHHYQPVPAPLYAIQSSLVSVETIEEQEDESDMKMYLYHVNFKNFWKQTRASFTPCDRPPKVQTPDFKSKRSWYWDVNDEYVIRSSDHWSNSCGNIKDCFWTFDETAFRNHGGRKNGWLMGMCRYEDFERGKKSSMKRRINDRKVLNKKQQEQQS